MKHETTSFYSGNTSIHKWLQPFVLASATLPFSPFVWMSFPPNASGVPITASLFSGYLLTACIC